MRRQIFLVLLALAALAAAAAHAGVAKKEGNAGRTEKPKAQPQQVRYLGWKKGQFYGRRCMVLIVAPPRGKTLDVLVPNKNPKSAMMDPAQHVVDLVDRLQRGDIIEITAADFKGRPMLRSIRGIKVAADLPDYFTVEETAAKKVGLQEFLCVTVKRGDQTADLLVPNRKGDDGKWIPDQALAAKAQKFRKGDRVDVEIRKAGRRVYLRDISAYIKPEVARFVKRETKDIDGHKHVCAVVRAGDADRELFVPNSAQDAKGQPAPDPKLSAAVSRLRPGQAVEYKARSEGDKTILRAIAATSKTPKEAPKGKDRPKN